MSFTANARSLLIVKSPIRTLLPNVGLHRLYSILTTEPNGVVQPIHDKAMPVLLMTAEDVEVWLNGTLEEALKLQKPQADDAIVITPYDEEKAA